MPRPGALQEELDIDLAIRSIAKDAGPELASALDSSGQLYRWEKLLPDLVTRLLEVLLTSGEPEPSDDRDLGAAVRRCARDWVPLHEVELCFQIVLACTFRRLWQMARPPACAELLQLSAQASAAMPIVLATIRRAYIEEMGVRRAEEMIVAALLEEGDAERLAEEAGIAFPETSLVVCVMPRAEAGGSETAALSEVPRGFRNSLCDGAVCASTPDRSRILALLPMCAAADPESEPDARALAAGLVEACEEEYGEEYVAGLAFARRPGETTAAAEEAMWVGGLLARVGDPGQAGFLLDIVPEAMIAERADLRGRLMTRLGRVRARRPLWTTLRALYENDLDRGRTARWLGIHRSTLDYRLNCVERITNVSPTSVRGIVLFSAGLAADDLGP